jgi:hypothetical protein
MAKKPRPVVAEPTGVYVRLPVPPQVLAALSEHVSNVARVRGLLEETDGSAIELGRAVLAALDAAARDAGAVHTAIKRRRRRR